MYDHYMTSLGRYDNTAIAVGSGSLPYNLKVEERRNGIWSTSKDFPFAKTYIKLYSMVTYDENLYLFGMFWLE